MPIEIDDIRWITNMDWSQLYTYLNGKEECLHLFDEQ